MSASNLLKSPGRVYVKGKKSNFEGHTLYILIKVFISDDFLVKL